MNIKNSLSFVVLTVILTATIGMMPIIQPGNLFAQSNSTAPSTNNTMSNDMMKKNDYGNNTMSNDMMKKNDYGKRTMGIEHEKYQKIKGTLNIMETMYKAIEAKFNVSLTDAITTAEQAVGNGSYAMSANGEERDGYLVYSIVLGSPDMQFTKVLVDPGNGSVLQTKNISMMEWMMMMHSQGHQNMGMSGMHDGQGYGKYNSWKEHKDSAGW